MMGAVWIATAAIGLITVALLIVRDEDMLAAVWDDLLTPSGRRYGELIAEHGAILERALASTKKEATQARREGDFDHAQRLTRAAESYAAQTRKVRRQAALMRRMLSAVSRPPE